MGDQLLASVINGWWSPKYKDKRRGETLVVECVECDVRTPGHWAGLSVSKLAVYGFDETDNETPGLARPYFRIISDK